MNTKRILLIILVILFQDGIGIAKEHSKTNNTKEENSSITKTTRVRSPNATECLSLGKNSYLFCYDPQKWSSKPFEGFPNIIEFTGIIDKFNATVMYGTSVMSSKARFRVSLDECKKSKLNLEIISQEQRIINGSTVIVARIDIKGKGGKPLPMVESFFSGKGGSVTVSSVLLDPKQEIEFHDFINGLITESLSDCSTTKARKVWLDKYKPSWTDADRQTVAEKKIKLGMTEDQAETSWGSPESKNNTVTQYGKRTQWVYKAAKTYLYFEDGKLTAWQD
jgi:hypothetical protein